MATPAYSILLVDSDPQRLLSIRSLLSEPSCTECRVLEAHNLNTALGLLKSESIGVVVSALRFDGAKGLDSLLRYREFAPRVSVVALLKDEEKGVVLEAAQSLSDDCLFYSNLNSDRLWATIRLSLDRRGMSNGIARPMEVDTSERSEYELLLNRLDQAVFLVARSDGAVLFSNGVAEKWFGDSIPSVMADVCEYGVLSGDELEVEISLSNLHVSSAEMRSVGVVWQNRDCCFISLRNILKRKRAESAYKSAQRRLELALKASNVGFWSWDLRGHQLQFSERWKALIGYKNSEFLDTLSAYRDAIHPEDREGAVGEFRRFLKGEVKDLERKFRLRHANGSYRHILCRAEIFPDNDGRLALVLGTHIDITEKRVLEERGRLALTSKNDPSLTVANMVRGRIESHAEKLAFDAASVRSHFRSDSKIVRDIKGFELDALRISRLTDWLSELSASNLSKGKGSDLAAAIMKNADEYEKLLPVKCELSIGDVPSTLIDCLNESALKLLIAEMLSVVSEYIHKEYKSKVVLKIGEGSEKRLEVEYMGTSVCGEDLRALSIGSGVMASAIGREERSVLVVRFDVDRPGACAPVGKADEPAPVALLAEDEGVLRLAIQSMLESIGYDVILAENGALAVDKFIERSMDISIALVDLHMPEVAGERVVESIRSIRKDLPIIKMSGDDEQSIGEAFGFDDSNCCFLSKPFGIAELKRSILSLGSFAKSV